MLSTDGFANSYKNEDEFKKTCSDYFGMLKEHGAEAVKANLKEWLNETSEMGCGDDITLLIAFFSDDTVIDLPSDTFSPATTVDAPTESEAKPHEQQTE